MEVFQRPSLAPRRRSALHWRGRAEMQRRRPADGRCEDEEGQRRAGAVATAQIESGSVGARVGTG
jgi:hypothetical protein